MTQFDAFESEFAVAMRDYVADAPASIDPVAYVRALREATAHRPVGLLQRRLPRYSWLVLAALLGVALLAAFAVGFGNRPSVLPAPSATAAPSASATPPARRDMLAFTRGGDLWILTEGVTEPVLVADDVAINMIDDVIFASNYRWLYWSSNGATLAIYGLSETDTGDTPPCIALFDAESGAVSEVPGCPTPRGPAGWATDDSLLVRSRGVPDGLFAIDRTTGELTQLSSREACVPVVSPDDEWVAAVVGGNVQVASTSDYVWSDVAENSGYSCGPWTGWDAPTWSPDSERVAFVSGLNGLLGADPSVTAAERATISIINRDGTEHIVIADQAASWALPKWSPDGEWISFRGNDGLHVIRPDGTDDRLVYAGDVDRGRVSWAGDGSRIYFGVPPGGSTYDEIALWAYDLSTDSAELVNTGGLIADFAPRP